MANDVSRADAGFGVDTNAVTLITPAGETALPLMSKRDVADGILDAVAALMGGEMTYANVIVDLSAEAVDRLFSYAVPEGMDVQPGQLVAVPFGPRTLEGFVVSLSDTCDLPPEKVKPVLRVVREEPVVLPDLMELAEWMHVRYLCNLVDALRLMLPAQMRGGRVRERTTRWARLNLTDGELEAFIAANPRPCCRSRSAPVERLTAALEGGGGRFLLHGVTGSGKTEVYIRLIRRALELGRTAIVLVPEIALTPQMVAWLHGRFGGDAAVLHSALSAGERFDEWRRIRSGEARVVIGARSAVFAPVQNLGVIVVDEEHETTYQSDHRPRYDAREVAWKRAGQHGAVLLLGSATPSITTYMRAMPGVRPENRLELIELRQRVNGRPLPEVEIVDMRGEFERGNHSIFSARLAAELRACLDDGHQAMLFINRRGHSTFVSCRACGYVVKCDQCDVSMTWHQAENALRCHYCGKTLPPPKKCPNCGSAYIKYFGAGTQKVQEEVRRLFPDARVARMDVDTTREKDAHARILNRFRSGEANVLVGTQMIAKGLDFPNVALVGVVAADLSLNLPDFRSVERTFQLITQVAGRAGRADVPGRVVVQTYDPDHYGIQLAAAQDYRAFYTRESAYRRAALYPPFTVIARIIYSGRDPEAAAKAAAKAAEARWGVPGRDRRGAGRDPAGRHGGADQAAPGREPLPGAAEAVLQGGPGGRRRADAGPGRRRPRGRAGGAGDQSEQFDLGNRNREQGWRAGGLGIGSREALTEEVAAIEYVEAELWQFARSLKWARTTYCASIPGR